MLNIHRCVVGVVGVLTSMKTLIIVMALCVLPVSADAQTCMGYAGVGGPCYAGVGGPMYAGVGGPMYAGVGGPAYAGVGRGSGWITVCTVEVRGANSASQLLPSQPPR